MNAGKNSCNCIQYYDYLLSFTNISFFLVHKIILLLRKILEQKKQNPINKNCLSNHKGKFFFVHIYIGIYIFVIFQLFIIIILFVILAHKSVVLNYLLLQSIPSKKYLSNCKTGIKLFVCYFREIIFIVCLHCLLFFFNFSPKVIHQLATASPDSKPEISNKIQRYIVSSVNFIPAVCLHYLFTFILAR